jgi:hypothetical protein
LRSQTNRQAYMDSAPALKKTFDAAAKSVGEAWQEIIDEDVAAVATYAENLELIEENIPTYVDSLDELGISDQGQRDAIRDEMEGIATNYNGYLEELEGLQGKLSKKGTARKKELKKLIGAGNKRLKNIVSETGKLADVIKNLGENNGRLSAANNYTEDGKRSVAGVEQLTNPASKSSKTGTVGMANAWLAQEGFPGVPYSHYDETTGDLLIGEGEMSIKEMSDGVILKAEDEGIKIQKLIDGAYNVTFANPASLEHAKGQASSQLTQYILGSGTNSLSDDAVMSLAADDNLIGDIKGANLVSRETLRSGDVKAVREELYKSLEFTAHANLEAGKEAERANYEGQLKRQLEAGGKKFSGYNKGDKDKDGGGKSLTPAEERARTKITQTKTAQTAFTNFRDISKEDMASKETREKLLRSLRSNMNSNLKIEFQGLDKKVGIKRMEISESKKLPGTIMLTVYGEGSEGDEVQKIIAVDLNNWDADIPAFREFIENELLLQQWKAEEIIK